MAHCSRYNLKSLNSANDCSLQLPETPLSSSVGQTKWITMIKVALSHSAYEGRPMLLGQPNNHLDEISAAVASNQASATIEAIFSSFYSNSGTSLPAFVSPPSVDTSFLSAVIPNRRATFRSLTPVLKSHWLPTRQNSCRGRLPRRVGQSEDRGRPGSHLGKSPGAIRAREKRWIMAWVSQTT